MNYTTGQAMTVFGVSRETIRNWSADFGAFLSKTSKPGKGKSRVFSDEDMSVFALIADLRKQGASQESIISNLQSGQRGQPPHVDATALANSGQHSQVATLQSALTRLSAEIDRLKPYENQSIELRGQLMEARQQRDEMKRELREAYEEIGRLKAGK